MDQPSTQPQSTQPKNWLVESILVTLFCCLPFGIVGIVYAARVNSEWAAGNPAGAERASKEAGKWTKIGFFIGLAVIALYCILWLIFGITFFTGWSNAVRNSGY